MYDFVFIVSIFDLFENPNDFEMLCKSLSLNIDPEWLEKEYDDVERGQGDAYLFQSHDGCLFLDLFNEPTDQNEMILVGVRCKKELYVQIKIAVTSIYRTGFMCWRRRSRIEENSAERYNGKQGIRAAIQQGTPGDSEGVCKGTQ